MHARVHEETIDVRGWSDNRMNRLPDSIFETETRVQNSLLLSGAFVVCGARCCSFLSLVNVAGTYGCRGHRPTQNKAHEENKRPRTTVHVAKIDKKKIILKPKLDICLTETL